MKLKGLIRSSFSLVLLLGLSLACISYFLETKGLPDSSLYILKQFAKKHNCELEVGSMEAGLIRGLSVRTFQLKRADFSLRASELHITPQRSALLKGKFIADKFSLRNGLIRIPFKEKGKTVYHSFNFPLIEASLKGDSLEISQMKINGNNYKLKIHSSQITLPKSTPRSEQDSTQLSLINDILKEIALLETESPIEGQLSFNLPIDSPDKLTAKLQIKIPEILTQGLLLREINADALFNSNGSISIPKLSVKIDEKESLEGTLNWDPNKDNITGKLRGKVFPDRILKILAPTIVPEMQFLNFSEAPKFEFNIKRLPIQGLIKGTNSIEDILIDSGNIEIKNALYRKLPIKFAQSRISFENGKISFQDFDVFGHKLQGRINLFIDLMTTEILLRGKATGDPIQLSNFPQAENVRSHFLHLWDDFHWDPQALPTFGGTFHMFYNEKEDMYENVFYGFMSAANLTYHKLKTSHAKTKIYVTSHFALVDDLRVTLPDEQFSGSINFLDLQKDTKVNINLKGQLQAAKILDLFSDGWREELAFAEFNSIPDFSIKATIPVNTPINSTCVAELQFPQAKLFNIHVENAQASINFREKNLQINILSPQLHNGNLNASFMQNIQSTTQKLTIGFKNVDLNSLISQVGSNKFKLASGNLSGGANLIINDKPGAPPQVDGSGSISVVDGNFWQVPILTPLLSKIHSVLPFNATGQISELHAELKFKSHQIITENLVTDGNIIALSANGHYDWEKENFNFDVKTHYLQNIIKLPKPFNFDILSGVFTPVTSILEGRVSGTKDKWHWELQNFKNIKKFFNKIADSIMKPFQKILKD